MKARSHASGRSITHGRSIWVVFASRLSRKFLEDYINGFILRSIDGKAESMTDILLPRLSKIWTRLRSSTTFESFTKPRRVEYSLGICQILNRRFKKR